LLFASLSIAGAPPAPAAPVNGSSGGAPISAFDELLGLTAGSGSGGAPPAPPAARPEPPFRVPAAALQRAGLPPDTRPQVSPPALSLSQPSCAPVRAPPRAE
jgi:hypothetical protein